MIAVRNLTLYVPLKTPTHQLPANTVTAQKLTGPYQYFTPLVMAGP